MFRKLIYPICLVFVLSLIFTNTTSAALVGWWKLDDGSGTTAADSSSGNNGTLFGDPVWIDGYIDGALSFDGTDDYIDLPISSLLSSLEDSTFASWVNWNGVGGVWQRVLDFGTGETVNMFLTLSIGGSENMRFAITIGGNAAGAEDQTTTEDNFPPGDWHHVAVTMERDDPNTIHKLYIDGEVAAENTSARYTPSDMGDVNQIWLGRSQYSADPYYSGALDDFRIYDVALNEFQIHAVGVSNYQQTWKPRPANGEDEVVLNPTLVWNQGIVDVDSGAVFNEHQLYLGTDFNDVNSSTEPTEIITDANEYQFSADYNVVYYWRVDEVNPQDPNNPIKGEVWSFQALNFPVVVENFEDYNDFPPNEIFNFWLDGWGDPTNGSTSGYPAPDFVGGGHYLEDGIVHSGEFSMPLFYDNSAGLSYATKTLTSNRDWTKDDSITLTIFFHGDAGNETVPMYVAVNDDAVVTHPEPRAVLINEWTRWDIPLQDLADMGVNLTSVNSITLGFGDVDNPTPGGEGHVYFDDIRLYRSVAQEYQPKEESVDPGNANLVAYYKFEDDVRDSSGNNRNGTAYNNPTYTTGPTGYGSAIKLNGLYHYVGLPIDALVSTLNDCTIATWVNWTGEDDWERIFDFGDPPATADEDPMVWMMLSSSAAGYLGFSITLEGNTPGAADATNARNPLPTGWHHVAIVIDSTNMTHTLYLDGKVVGETTDARLLPSDLGQTSQNWIGRSQWAADPYFEGSIDEFHIYNRVLTDAEILYLTGW